MKTGYYNKCLNYNFEELFKRKKYKFFTKGNYNVNIIGIRSINSYKVTNKFDDVLILDYNTEVGHKRKIYTITTKPGLSVMRNPINKKGTAILVPGQYCNTYSIGLHKGKYKALCQNLKPVKVYRDIDKDEMYDLYPETIENGMFGINIHRSNETYTRESVDGYSAGCQVFNNPKDFISFMRVIEKSKTIYGNSFTYTLITEDDLI